MGVHRPFRPFHPFRFSETAQITFTGNFDRFTDVGCECEWVCFVKVPNLGCSHLLCSIHVISEIGRD